MRLILVKPTNATRRIDSTGEVFQHEDHELCASGGPEEKHDPYPGTSAEASSSPHEKSQFGTSSSLYERSNGISHPKGSAQMSPLRTQNLTLSELSDQDWLLLCGQVDGVRDDPPSAGRTGTNVGERDHKDRRGCPCSDAQQLQSKQVTGKDDLSRGTNKKNFTSLHTLSQTHVSATCLGLERKTNQRDLQKPAKHRSNVIIPQCIEQESRKEQPRDRFKLKDTSKIPCPNLFNIPIDSIEFANTNNKVQKQPNPVLSAHVNWRELFGKEPLLVQEHQKKTDSHCSITGDQTCESSEDPSVVLKCCHLPYSRPPAKRSSTPVSQKSLKSFSTSQCSSLENQLFAEEKTRQVHSFCFHIIHGMKSWYFLINLLEIEDTLHTTTGPGFQLKLYIRIYFKQLELSLKI